MTEQETGDKPERVTMRAARLVRTVSYAGYCQGCGQITTWGASTQRVAVRELRYDGWEMRDGLWLCPKCAKGGTV